MIFRFGAFGLDEEKYELRCDGAGLPVEPKVLDLLFYLVRHRDRLVTKDELLRELWSGAVVAEGVLTRAVSLARSAIGDSARGHGAIETVSGRGYRFRAAVDVLSAGEAPRPRAPRRRILRALGLGTGALLLLLGVAAWLTWPAAMGVFLDLAGLRDPPRHPPLPDRPSVVVLPFTDMSPDPTRAYLAEGITEDVTTGLARFRELFVIARSSAFTYRDQPVDVARVGRELGVRYLIEGSVRVGGDRVLVTAQLIDATTAFHLWSDRYDRRLDDVLSLETEVSAEILDALGVRIDQAELERLPNRVTPPPDAYAAFMQGRALWNRFVRADNERARALFTQAIAQEPGYARAYGYLAATHVAAYGLGWDPVPDELEQATLLADQALERDPSEPAAHAALAGAHLWAGRPAEAVDAAQRAVDLGPNSDACYGMLAMALAADGRVREAIGALNRALRLNPRSPSPYWMVMGYLQAAAGRREKAADTFEQVRTANADLIPPRIELISYYDDRERYAKARTLAAEILAVNPTFSAELALRLDRSRDPGAALRLREQLQRAGLP